MSTRPHRLRRSELSTPGSSPKMIAKAAQSAADLVFLDLEDAVAPSEKIPSRANIIAGLSTQDWGSKTRAYRINGVHTQWCHGDVIDVVGAAGQYVDVIIVPKVKSPRDVWFVDDLLTQVEIAHDLEVGRIGLELLIEETEALSCVEEIAACSPRLEALILGVGDLSASQGIRAGHIGGGQGGAFSYPGDMWHYARNRMIVAARANGIDAIDGPFGGIKDPDGYRVQAAQSATLGAVGKWAIHPSQIEIANEVYAPTRGEIDNAKAVVQAVREAEAAGNGAANLNGVMIDAATARIFEAVLEQAELCGLE
ncbi:HpcH/HpaI aldolase/citrate lyase family protein [Cumulibacter manganitolerans]|uniref:HpcH/HpaI aldolase/citrate lyase family protein n=1 Tax=Cumulibacter manganitolerans TaxID=1884992 RepID=UPI00129606F2|nr:CoA ester lyase [Cumulibacter manganitolerans]